MYRKMYRKMNRKMYRKINRKMYREIYRKICRKMYREHPNIYKEKRKNLKNVKKYRKTS